MARWRVSGSVVGGTVIGEFEAKTAQEAFRKAWKEADVSLCHQCARHVSNLEVERLTAENDETGEVVEEGE